VRVPKVDTLPSLLEPQTLSNGLAFQHFIRSDDDFACPVCQPNPRIGRGRRLYLVEQGFQLVNFLGVFVADRQRQQGQLVAPGAYVLRNEVGNGEGR